LAAPEKYALLSSVCENGAIFTGKANEAARRFYMGYCLERRAQAMEDRSTRNEWCANALGHFTAFLEICRHKGEPAYYALLKSAQLMVALEYPWRKAEGLLLEAFEIMPGRGEAIETIQRHYLSTGEFPVAYIFTSYAFQAYFMRSPSTDKWGVNETFYKWRVLDQHIAACFNMGLRDEAGHFFNQLVELTRRDPGYFEPSDIQRIQVKSELFKNPVAS
jgi:hypothetical protein